MARSPTASERPSFLGNPLKWSEAGRCLFVVSIMLPGVLVFLVSVALADGWGYLPSTLDEPAWALMEGFAWAGPAIWSVLLLGALWFRKHKPDSRFMSVLLVQVYSVTSASFILALGIFHSAGWILFLGGAIVSFFLFGRRLTLLGIVTFVAIFAVLIVSAHNGRAGNILDATRAPPVGDPAWSGWFTRMAITTAVFATLMLALMAYIISLLRDREERLDILAKTDGLTKVTNRREFMNVVGAEFARADRYDTPLSLVMVDLDHFKQVNDRFGHLAGDTVLAGVAGVMQDSVRDSDLVARYGGEEFVLLLPNTDAPGAALLAERCRELIATSKFDYPGGKLSVTASMGIASYPSDDMSSLDDLLNAADAAMYAAKRSGRDRVLAAGSGDHLRVADSSNPAEDSS